MLPKIIVCVSLLVACGDDGKKSVDASIADASPDSKQFLDGPTECNAIAPPSNMVAVTRVASPPPTAMGGTIMPGHYVVTSLTDYTGSGGASGPTGQTAQIESDNDGTHFWHIQKVTDSNGSSEARFAGTFALNGTMLEAQHTCPDTTLDMFGYTSTPTSFTLLQLMPGPHTLEFVFTKQ
jgi:hypothetical protein